MSPGLNSVSSATSEEFVRRSRGSKEKYLLRSGSSSAICKPRGRNCTIPLLPMSMNLRYSAEKTSGGGCPKFTTAGLLDRKSTRLNSSHTVISYAVFCLKKKKKNKDKCIDNTINNNKHMNFEYSLTYR